MTVFTPEQIAEWADGRRGLSIQDQRALCSSHEELRAEVEGARDDREKAEHLLRECHELLGRYADADHNGVSYVPNDAMRLISEIEAALT